MLTLIEGAQIHSPAPLGQQDLLVADGRIAWMGKGLTVPADWPLTRVDAGGRYLVPGLVDPLAHITGGGGEGGFGFRTPELSARAALAAGVTTLVAALGTDSLTRSPAQVLGKVREFRAAGVSAFMYTGSYHLPVKTLTGTVESDIMLIPEVLGVGEVAISDHRSSAPTHDELARLASEARVAGLLSGKSGVSFFHLGDGRGGAGAPAGVAGRHRHPATPALPHPLQPQPLALCRGHRVGSGRRLGRPHHVELPGSAG